MLDTNLIVVLIGAPGSGKGTQSMFLEQKFGFKHVATGDLLREEVASQSELGKQIADIMGSGGLVSSDIVNSVMKAKICAIGKEYQLLLLDGYPRTVEQSKFLDEVSSQLTNTRICVIQIDVDANSIVKRMSSRIMCEKCKTPFKIEDNLKTCPVCGGESFIRRKDDEPAIVLERIEAYNSVSKKVLDYYGDRVTRVDGDRSSEEVSCNIENILQDLGLSLN